MEDDASEGKSFKYKTKIMGKSELKSPQSTQPLANLDGSQPPQSPQVQVPPFNTEFLFH